MTPTPHDAANTAHVSPAAVCSILLSRLAAVALVLGLSTGGAGIAAAVPVTFWVTAPQATAQQNTAPGQSPTTVFLAGNFQNWSPGDPAWQLQPAAPGRYVLTADFPAGTGLQFKFTRGSWLTVEKGSAGQEIDNRLYVVAAHADTLDLEVASWASGEAVERASTVTGDVETYTVPDFLDGRRVWVYLPPGYRSQPDRRFPVLYMFDGQNVFDDATSFVGEWQVDEALATAIAAGRVAELIVVAVDNGQDKRMAEYTPWSSTAYPSAGSGQRHLRRWVEVLLPWVNRTFRTLTGPGQTGLAGSSLGGLMSLYGGFRYPDVFGRIGAFSPTLSLPPQKLSAYCAAEPGQPQAVYIDMGTREEGNLSDRDHDGVDDHISALRRLQAVLQRRGFLGGWDLMVSEDEGARHNEKAWSRRFPAAVEFLFPAQ